MKGEIVEQVETYKYLHSKKKCLDPKKSTQQFPLVFLSCDNLILNYIEPTNYITLGKLAFPFQSKILLSTAYLITVSLKASF